MTLGSSHLIIIIIITIINYSFPFPLCLFNTNPPLKKYPNSIHQSSQLPTNLNHQKTTQKTFPQQKILNYIHPWRLTWNIIMEVWKITFLSKWVICRFHVNLPGCSSPNLFCINEFSWESSHSWDLFFLFCRTNKQPSENSHGFPTHIFLSIPKKNLIQTSCGRSALNSPSRPTFPPDPDLDVLMLRPTTWTVGSQPQLFGGEKSLPFSAHPKGLFFGRRKPNRIISWGTCGGELWWIMPFWGWGGWV